MSATAVMRSAGRTDVNQRRSLRYPLSVPVDVTILRSGVPYSIPGRCLDLGEGGIGAVLSGELPSQASVGLAFRFPHTELLEVKAVVRHQRLLRCGLEFLNLSLEERTLIARWAQATATPTARAKLPAIHAQTSVQRGRTVPPAASDRPRAAVISRVLWAVLVLFIMIGILGWWQWREAWTELEARIPAMQPHIQQRANVPSEVMERLITHKIDPDYPESARQARVQGVVILDAVIGADGTVVDLKPIGGPESLAVAAVEAVKWWRFQPYRVDGQPVPVETTLAVDFRGD